MKSASQYLVLFDADLRFRIEVVDLPLRGIAQVTQGVKFAHLFILPELICEAVYRIPLQSLGLIRAFYLPDNDFSVADELV